MDYVMKYVKNKKLSENIIPSINQITLHKKIILPYKLIGLNGIKRTIESVEVEEKRCIYWKYKMLVVLKPLKKPIKLWNDFMKLLRNKRVKIIVVFKEKIECKYEILRDKRYIKKKKN